MTKSTAEKIADKLKDENFLDKFMLIMRILDDGIMGRKRVTKQGGGSVGALYIPKQYIGREVRYIIVPVSSALKDMEEALMYNEKNRLKLKRKYLKLLEEKNKLLSEAGPIDEERIKQVLAEAKQVEEEKIKQEETVTKTIPLINAPNKDPEDEKEDEY